MSFQVKLSLANSAEEASDEVSFVISIFENVLPSDIFSYIVKSDSAITITGFNINFLILKHMINLKIVTLLKYQKVS